MRPHGAGTRKTLGMQEGDNADKQPAMSCSKSLCSVYYNKFAKFVMNKHGASAGFILTIIGILLGLAGNYYLLPYQHQIADKKSEDQGAWGASVSPATPPVLNHEPVATGRQTSPLEDTEIAASERRRSDLRKAAEKWKKRESANYTDFTGSKNAINSDDQSHFNDEDQEAWNTLSAAEQLLQWRVRGLNATTKAVLPIYVQRDNSGTVSNRMAKAIAATLSADGFKITDVITDAALIIDVQNGNSESIDQDCPHFEWRAVTTVHLTVAWLGGDAPRFFNTPVSEMRCVLPEKEAIGQSFEATQSTAISMIENLAR